MPQCIVIADDLTGANATGVLLKKMNYKAYTVMNAERIELKTSSQYDCLLYPTDSRGISPELAYNRVLNVCGLLKDDSVKVYSKRIDSTLRGNLGSETDAMLDCLSDEYVAIVVPCFPSSKRINLGGYMLVDGELLQKTNIAIDPKTPVKVSCAHEIFSMQSKYKVASIYINDMMHGKHYLADRIKEKVASGCRIIIFDAINQEDIDLIADAVITSKLKTVCVDPGVYTSTMARKTIIPYKSEKKNRILSVVGSVNPNTKAQIEELWLSSRVYSVIAVTEEFIKSEERRNVEIERVVKEILDNADRFTVLTVTGDGIYFENRIDFEEYTKLTGKTVDELTQIINDSFATIAYRIFKAENSFKGIYTSGGDVTVAVCKKFNTDGLCLLDEVLPLAAYGQIINGEFDQVHIITKGGSQGDKNAILKCITYLKEKLYI